MAHPGGRPLKFQSVEELQKKIDAYFAQCDPHMEEVTEWVQARDSQGKLKKDKAGLNYLVEVTHKVMTEQKAYTVTGLALALDTSRQTLLEYQGEVEGREAKSPEFADTIKKAKQKVEYFWEHNLVSTSPTGTIFNLKNNFGWQDKTQQELTNPDGTLSPYNSLSPEELRKLADKK